MDSVKHRVSITQSGELLQIRYQQVKAKTRGFHLKILSKNQNHSSYIHIPSSISLFFNVNDSNISVSVCNILIEKVVLIKLFTIMKFITAKILTGSVM